MLPANSEYFFMPDHIRQEIDQLCKLRNVTQSKYKAARKEGDVKIAIIFKRYLSAETQYQNYLQYAKDYVKFFP